MLFMNEYDVENAVYIANSGNHPNLRRATRALHGLVQWTNSNSDGWAYWPKPCRAAKNLMLLIQSVDRFDPEDVSSTDVDVALRPIRSFLTRQQVNVDDVAAIFG